MSDTGFPFRFINATYVSIGNKGNHRCLMSLHENEFHPVIQAKFANALANPFQIGLNGTVGIVVVSAKAGVAHPLKQNKLKANTAKPTRWHRRQKKENCLGIRIWVAWEVKQLLTNIKPQCKEVRNFFLEIELPIGQ